MGEAHLEARAGKVKGKTTLISTFAELLVAMNYLDAATYLEEVRRRGIQLGLDRVRGMLSDLGNPQNTFKSILVTGTNGKGSTGMYLSSILQEAGYKVGTYTSPPLYDHTERILVNKRKIPKQEFAGLIGKVKPHAEAHNATFFETITAAAYLYFSKNKIDWAVLEVGMGGRLDATNVVEPEVSVITNIELDHTQFLGTTITQIAKEKAGIIHQDSVLVCSETKPEAVSVLKQTCEEKNSEYHQVQDEYPVTLNSFSHEKQTFNAGKYKNLETELLDISQPTNAAAAISAAEKIDGITETQIRDGIKKTKWPGRLEIVQQNPLTILSAAHNPAGFRNLAQTLSRIPHDKTITILGICKDKDTEAMAKLADKFSNRIYKTSFNHPRSWEGHINLDEAVSTALAETRPEDLILITGSIFLIGEIRKRWEKEVVFT